MRPDSPGSDSGEAWPMKAEETMWGKQKEIYKNKYKAPFLYKDNEQDTSFMEGEPNSFHMIWSNVKNKNADLNTASEHELRFDTGNTCISFGTGSFMGQLEMTSSYEILTEDWNTVQQYMWAHI